MQIIITIDAEADNAWLRTSDLSVANLAYLPRFQKLCRMYGFTPTYLCTYEVLKSSQFKTMQEKPEFIDYCEIGAHLHPWSTPPYVSVTDNDFKYHPYPHELPRQLFREKLENLTKLASEVIGEPPVSYRAGRWGFAKDDIPILVELGYKIDCSVTPNVSWADTPGIPSGEGGPDYTTAGCKPYFADVNNICDPGTSMLFEMPMTILYTRPNLVRHIEAWGNHIIQMEGRYEKFIKKIRGDAHWFRPFPWMNTKNMIKVYEAAKQKGLPYVMMMLHSSELMPNGSPYNPDKDSIEKLYTRLKFVFEHIAKDGCKGTTLKEFYARNHQAYKQDSMATSQITCGA